MDIKMHTDNLTLNFLFTPPFFLAVFETDSEMEV